MKVNPVLIQMNAAHMPTLWYGMVWYTIHTLSWWWGLSAPETPRAIPAVA
jgi:hypothetical protein